MLSFSPTKLVISEFKIGHRKKSKKKGERAYAPSICFFRPNGFTGSAFP